MKFMKKSNKITSSLSLPSLVISPHCFFFHCFCTVVYIVYVCYVYHCEHTKRAIHFLSCSKVIWCKYTIICLYPSICSVKFWWKLKPSFFLRYTVIFVRQEIAFNCYLLILLKHLLFLNSCQETMQREKEANSFKEWEEQEDKVQFYYNNLLLNLKRTFDMLIIQSV